jgi:hypothetical protein
MIAEMIEQEFDTADVFFLVAIIIAAVAAVLYAMASTRVTHADGSTDPHDHRRAQLAAWGAVAGWISVAFLSAGFFVL